MIFIKCPKVNECLKASEARRSPWRRRGQGSFASVTFCKGKNLAGRGSANKKYNYNLQYAYDILDVIYVLFLAFYCGYGILIT